MKRGTQPAVLGIAIAALLVMTVAPAAIVATEPAEENEFEGAELRPFQLERLSHDGPVATTAGGALVTPDSPEEDMEPCITDDRNGHTVVTWTHRAGTFDADIGMAYSSDGTAWESTLITMDGMELHSDVAYVHGSDFEGGGDFTGLWGCFGDIVNNNPGFFRIADITDSGTYEFYTWSSEYEDTRYTCISDHTWYNEFNYDVTGPTNMYIYHVVYDVYDIPACPSHWYVGGALEGGGIGYFDAQSKVVTAPAADPDMACFHDNDPAQTEDDYIILTWQYDNQTTGGSEVVVKKIVPNEEPDIEYTPYQYYLDQDPTYDNAHPNIGSSGDNAVIVYMTTDNVFGDWDIKCAYTSDGGENWGFSTVASEGQTDELYPAVFMSGSTAFCAYIMDGNLYVTKSEDGGATWNEAEQINEEDGTVVEEENAVDIHQSGIVWVDNRDGNKDIYYAPVPSAILEITGLSGGFGVSATITNSGTVAAENVEWAVELSGPVFVGASTSGTIDQLGPGESATVGPGLVLGVGPTTITVTAGGSSTSASGFVLGPFVLGL
ncbi:MAG: sialidase family protein [Thermoplasmatota archaeon]